MTDREQTRRDAEDPRMDWGQGEWLAETQRLEAELEQAELALQQIRDLPSEHDLLFNAEAKALWYIASEALER